MAFITFIMGYIRQEAIVTQHNRTSHRRALTSIHISVALTFLAFAGATLTLATCGWEPAKVSFSFASGFRLGESTSIALDCMFVLFAPNSNPLSESSMANLSIALESTLLLDGLLSTSE